MRREPEGSRSFAAGIHRYFPEWADRPAKDGVLWESDRNSYSAGGYAEEFGYAGQPGLPPPAKPLHGDPEQSGQWRIQISCIHPGYPQCCRPLDRDSLLLGVSALSCAGSVDLGRGIAGGPGADRATDLPGSRLPVFKVIRVGEHRSTVHVRIFRELVALWSFFGPHLHLKPHLLRHLRQRPDPRRND
jgi:hypothetical protein